MKRLRDSTVDRSTWPAAPASYMTGPHTPEGRTRRDGVHLDTLALPIRLPGQAPRSLAHVLAAYEQRAQDRVSIAAIEAIRLLDREDGVSTLNGERAQAAAELLFSLAQGPLLQRLATLWTMPYVLNLQPGEGQEVHTLEAKIQSIEQLKGLWPADTPVHLQLSTGLKGSVLRLLGFLAQTARLSVTLRVDEECEAMTLHSLAGALNDRIHQLPLDRLALQLGPHATPLLQRLCSSESCLGTRAQVLRFELLPGARRLLAGAGLSAHPLERAMVALTESSGALELDASSASLPGPLARKLVATRTAWDALHLHHAVETQQLLLEGRHTVARLELHPPANTKLQLTTEFLHLMQTMGLKALVVHGMLDLPGSIQALQRYMAAQQAQTLLELLDACFVAADQVDLEPILQTLQGQRWIARITHKAMALQARGYHLLTPHDAARLTSSAGLPRLAMAMEASSTSQSLINEAWPSAARALARLLAPDRSWADLVQGLKAPANWVIPRAVIAEREPPRDAENGLLHAKIQALARTPVPRALLKDALACALHDQPSLAGEMCTALILCEWPRQALTSQAWNTLAAPYKRRPWGDEAGATPANIGASTPDLGSTSAAGPIKTVVIPPPTRSTAPSTPVSQPIPSGSAARMAVRQTLQTSPPMASLLVPPNTANIVTKVRKALRERAKMLDVHPQHALAVEALKTIVGWLFSGHVATGALNGALRHEIAHQLLQAGQWKLLQHILPTHPVWAFGVGTAEQAAALQHLLLPPLCECTLEISAPLSAESLSAVSTFLVRLPPGQRVLGIVARPGDGAQVWRARSDLVKITPRISLWLNAGTSRAPQAQTSPEDAWLEHELCTFFRAIHNASLHDLRIDGIPLGGAGFVKAVAQAIPTTGAQALILGHCHDALARAILGCQFWGSVGVQAGALVAEVFASGAVTAQALAVHLPASGAIQLWAESILGACRQLEEVAVLGQHIDVMHLARALSRNPTVRAVRAAISAVNKAQSSAALTLMRSHPMLSQVEFLDTQPGVGVLPLGAADRKRLVELILTYRMRTPGNLAEGAIAAFAAHLVADTPQRFNGYLRPFDTLGHLIARAVDGPTARALSIVNRAWYARSRPEWAARTREVHGLLKPSVSSAGIAQSLKETPASQVLGSAADQPRHESAHRVLETVRGLRDIQVPTDAIVEAIGVLLSEAPQATPELLEALAYVGVLPAGDWLEQVLGIAPRGA